MCVYLCYSVLCCPPFLSAGDLSEKTTIYSTLVGILNARKMEVGEDNNILITTNKFKLTVSY